MPSLPKVVWETIRGAKQSVEELADRLGCSASLLYRAANPEDNEVDIKLRWLIPLMELTRNYSILHHLAHRLGFVCVRIPRAKKMKPEELAAHQALLAEYQLTLARYLQTEISKEECLAVVNEALSQVAGARKMVEAGSQLHLELE